MEADFNTTDALARDEMYGQHVRAPFALRCGALLVDYTLVAGIAACGTLLAQLFGGGSRRAGSSVIEFALISALAVAILNFSVLPGFTGRTLGKWVTGLRIERRDGEPLDFWSALLRHTAGYLLSLLPLGLGFLLAAFNAEGRALHDMIAGTVVVRDSGARLR
jgi:uncharacterized RDD family membrane protein YckC